MTNISRRSFLLASAAFSAAPATAQVADSTAAKLITSAREQVGVTLTYDPAYTNLAFPNGDVPRDKGVCTDVIVRAYRDALGIDLQQLINADMKRAFASYPKRWGMKTTDRNIDHRRVLNLEVFWTRQGAKLAVPKNAADWQPGDLVTSLVGGTLPHVAIISDKKTPAGQPLILHNIGAGAREEDALLAHKITGRYRWKLDA
jgi:uncharacterized protein